MKGIGHGTETFAPKSIKIFFLLQKDICLYVYKRVNLLLFVFACGRGFQSAEIWRSKNQNQEDFCKKKEQQKTTR